LALNILILCIALQAGMKSSVTKITRALSFSLIILCLLSSFKMMEPGGKEQKKAAASQEKKKEGTREVLTTQRAFEAVVPFVQVKFSHDFYIVRVQEFTDLVKDYISINEPLPIIVYFKNLFSYVICVNAP
jgi:hypothetical protein